MQNSDEARHGLQGADRVRQALAAERHELGGFAVAALAQPATVRQEVSPAAPLGIYTLDFYCAEAKLAVEIDGSGHATDEGKHKDEARDAWLRGQGIEVLRFGGFEVEEETKRVLERIDEALLRRCKSPSSPALLPRGTGGEGS